ncbi:MAG: hypothetical protein PHQ88_09050 [Bacteroides sp.]|nr:hypothetical protein [Bacteroides sp.]
MGGGGFSNYTRDLPSRNEDCDSILLTVDLQKPQASLIDYKINDILDVVLKKELVYVTGEHGLCGYIPAAQHTQLFKCLEKGKSFIARIISITDTNCTVRISPNIS